MGFPRQEYWSGLPFPSPGYFPTPGIKPGSPALQAYSLPPEPPGKPTVQCGYPELLSPPWVHTGNWTVEICFLIGSPRCQLIIVFFFNLVLSSSNTMCVCVCVCVCVSRLIVSDSLRPHELQLTRLLWPCNSPGKNTEVGSHSLLQGIFPTQGLNPSLKHYRWILYHLSHQGSLVHIITGSKTLLFLTRRKAPAAPSLLRRWGNLFKSFHASSKETFNLKRSYEISILKNH